MPSFVSLRAPLALRSAVLLIAATALPCMAAGPAATTPADKTTTTTSPDLTPQQTHEALATRIVHRMRLADADKTARLTQATTGYLNALHPILEERQTVLDRLEKEAGPQGKPDHTQVVAAYEKAKAAYLPLRDAFVKKLEADLHPYLVDRVKDGLTHDAFPKLHAMYLEMIPQLTPEEKAHITGLLVEARENAILAINHRGQKQWFDKYRGIINNFISAQGHDFPALSKAWDRANPGREKKFHRSE